MVAVNLDRHSYLLHQRPEIYVTMNFHQERGIIKCDLKYVEAMELEEIDSTPSGQRMGIVLINRNWPQIYAVNEREAFSEEQYFELAERLIRERPKK